MAFMFIIFHRQVGPLVDNGGWGWGLPVSGPLAAPGRGMLAAASRSCEEPVVDGGDTEAAGAAATGCCM